MWLQFQIFLPYKLNTATPKAVFAWQVNNTVAENFGLDLYNNSLFLFCGSRNDRFKALYWDDEGFILLYKRYENGSLRWPKNKSEVKELKPEQLNALFTGLSPFPERRIHTIKPGNLY